MDIQNQVLLDQDAHEAKDLQLSQDAIDQHVLLTPLFKNYYLMPSSTTEQLAQSHQLLWQQTWTKPSSF